MGRMLVDDVKLVFKFHQPVSGKQLANQLVAAAGPGFEELFLKEIQLNRRLPGWRLLHLLCFRLAGFRLLHLLCFQFADFRLLHLACFRLAGWHLLHLACFRLPG